MRRVREALNHIPPSYRTPLEELWRNMEYEEGGEFACCGVFQPRFTEKLTRADEVMSSTGKKLLIRIMKEAGKGARGLLKLHTEINLPDRVKTLRQPSIKSYMVKIGNRTEELEVKTSCTIVNRKKGKKGTLRRSKYVNPESEDSDDDDEEKPMRFPPPPERVYSKHIEVKNRAGQCTYWEWKAG